MKEETKILHQSELFKLGLALNERGVEYELHCFLNGLQIRVPAQDWDVFCNSASAGKETGLLEGFGKIFDDGLEGYLTANDVLERIDRFKEAV